MMYRFTYKGTEMGQSESRAHDVLLKYSKQSRSENSLNATADEKPVLKYNRAVIYRRKDIQSGPYMC